MFISKCSKCGKVYNPKDTKDLGTQASGLCHACAVIVIKDNYNRRTLEENLKDPYINSFYNEFQKETGCCLLLYNIEILKEVKKLEMSGNADGALKKLVSNKVYFPRQNSVTLLNEERRLSKAHIDKLILCGRYEDAAQHYEKLGMWKEAGDARRMERTVKNVNVDVNKLMDDLKYGGLGLQYKCMSCGASIQFSQSDVGRIRNCSYCGAAIDTEAMLTIIRELMK